MGHCLDKTLEKKKNLEPQIGFEIRVGFLLFYQSSIISFPDIFQECSLEQCLTASRAKTSKKKDLFYSNVIERPLKLACFISAASLILLVRKRRGC